MTAMGRSNLLWIMASLLAREQKVPCITGVQDTGGRGTDGAVLRQVMLTGDVTYGRLRLDKISW